MPRLAKAAASTFEIIFDPLERAQQRLDLCDALGANLVHYVCLGPIPERIARRKSVPPFSRERGDGLALVLTRLEFSEAHLLEHPQVPPQSRAIELDQFTQRRQRQRAVPTQFPEQREL